MTQAERLIRNLCEERRLGLLEAERDLIKRLPQQHTWSQLPPKVQSLVTEYRLCEWRQLAIQKDLARRGYHTHGYGLNKKKPSLALKNHDDQVRQAKALYERRRAAVVQLRTSATIEALGKTAQEAQGILKQLQRDLAKA